MHLSRPCTSVHQNMLHRSSGCLIYPEFQGCWTLEVVPESTPWHSSGPAKEFTRRSSTYRVWSQSPEDISRKKGFQIRSRPSPAITTSMNWETISTSYF